VKIIINNATQPPRKIMFLEEGRLLCGMEVVFGKRFHGENSCPKEMIGPYESPRKRWFHGRKWG
jgi:hypothetical protein